MARKIEWTQKGFDFVYRLKSRAKAELQETLFETQLAPKEPGVYKVEHIHLKY